MKKTEIIEKILDEIVLGEFRESTDMIEDGLIDSFDMIQILTMIESEFDITIDTGEIERADFKDMDSIGKMVERAMNCK